MYLRKIKVSGVKVGIKEEGFYGLRIFKGWEGCFRIFLRPYRCKAKVLFVILKIIPDVAQSRKLVLL
jgi:hypothetical protein